MNEEKKSRNLPERRCIGCHDIGRLDVNCDTVFQPTSPRQLRCPECGKKVANERARVIMVRKYEKIGYPDRALEKNPNWRGGVGITRELAFKYHPEICMGCGSSDDLFGVALDGDKTNISEANLVVLCRKCAKSSKIILPEHERQVKIF